MTNIRYEHVTCKERLLLYSEGSTFLGNHPLNFCWKLLVKKGKYVGGEAFNFSPICPASSLVLPILRDGDNDLHGFKIYRYF